MADQEIVQKMEQVDQPIVEAPTADYAKEETIVKGERDANGIKIGAWESDFFSCFDHLVPNCLMSWICPWIAMAQIVARLGLYPYSKALLFFLGVFAVVVLLQMIGVILLSGGTSVSWHVNPDGTWEWKSHGVTGYAVFNYLSAAICLVYLFVLIQIRGKVRTRFQIPGEVWEDCLLSWCCGCCTIAQIATHIKSYNPGQCDFAAVDSLPPYLPNDQVA